MPLKDRTKQFNSYDAKLKNTEMFFLFSIIINPFIDALVGFLQFNTSSIFPFGAIFRSFLIILYLYLIYRMYSKDELYSIISKRKYLFLLFLVYLIIYFIKSFSHLNLPNSISQIIFVFRYFSFPIYLFLLHKILNKIQKVNIKKTMSYVSLIYSLFIIIPFLTGTGFNSYVIENLLGSVGWFVGANEIGIIIGLTSFSNLYYLDYSSTIQKSGMISYIIPLVAMGIIGTKVALAFLIFNLFCGMTIIYKQINYIHKQKLIIIMFASSAFLISQLPAVKNFMFLLNADLKLIPTILSGRDVYFKIKLSQYLSGGMLDTIFGSGFYVHLSDNVYGLDKLVEMDFFDILFRTGIVGTLLIFVPVLKFVKDKLYLLKSDFVSEINLFIMINILLILVISFISGHVFSAPSVSFFFALFISDLACQN